MRNSLATTIAVASLVLAGTASAEAPKPDYGRSGWYVGAGGGVAWDFLSDFIATNTGGLVTESVGGSANARVGYRVWSWFAVEAMYEGAYGVNPEILGIQAADFNTHSVLANLKFILPIWRVHPYFALGAGAQYGDFDGFLNHPVVGPILDLLDRSRWDPVLRFGLGVDGYITENWLVNVELAPGIRFKDWGDLGGTSTDNITLTLSAGVQYRF